MKKTNVLIGTLLFSFLMSAPALAKRERKGHFKKILKELNLSDEQLAEVKKFRKENKGKMKPLREEMKSIREKMKKSFIENASDEELRKLHVKMNVLHAQKTEHKFNKMLTLKKILDKSQRERFMELKKSGKRRNRE